MSLFNAVATVGSYTMISRVTGFARDVLIAASLGAGPIADAFFVAFKLPNFFRRLTAEGSFTIVFIPMFSGILEIDGKKIALEFAEENYVNNVRCSIDNYRNCNFFYASNNEFYCARFHR